MLREKFPFEQEYVDYLEIELGLSGRTIGSYCQVIRFFVRFLKEKWFAEELDVTEIEEKHIRNYLAYLKKERLNSPRSRNSHLVALRSYFGYLEIQGCMMNKKNPTRRLKNVKFAKKLPVFLNLDEAKAILAAAKGSPHSKRDFAIMKLFLQTGCRLSELLQLEISQINLKEKHVRFLGKGSKERIVPLTDSTCQAIMDYLAVRPPAALNSKQVFLSVYGWPISASNVYSLFESICIRAGIQQENVSIHTLRHTCFTLLLKAGVDIATIKEIAGHEDINTTSIYLHVTQNEVRTAMEKHPFR